MRRRRTAATAAAATTATAAAAAAAAVAAAARRVGRERLEHCRDAQLRAAGPQLAQQKVEAAERQLSLA